MTSSWYSYPLCPCPPILKLVSWTQCVFLHHCLVWPHWKFRRLNETHNEMMLFVFWIAALGSVQTLYVASLLMVTSSNGNIFQVTRPLSGIFISDALMFSSICAWTNVWVHNRDAGDLRRHRAHHDVTAMYWLLVSPCGIKALSTIVLSNSV